MFGWQNKKATVYRHFKMFTFKNLLLSLLNTHTHTYTHIHTQTHIHTYINTTQVGELANQPSKQKLYFG